MLPLNTGVRNQATVKPGTVAQTCNSSTQEAEAREPQVLHNLSQRPKPNQMRPTQKLPWAVTLQSLEWLQFWDDPEYWVYGTTGVMHYFWEWDTLGKFCNIGFRLNIHLLHDPELPLLTYFPIEMKAYIYTCVKWSFKALFLKPIIPVHHKLQCEQLLRQPSALWSHSLLKSEPFRWLYSFTSSKLQLVESDHFLRWTECIFPIVLTGFNVSTQDLPT